MPDRQSGGSHALTAHDTACQSGAAEALGPVFGHHIRKLGIRAPLIAAVAATGGKTPGKKRLSNLHAAFRSETAYGLLPGFVPAGRTGVLADQTVRQIRGVFFSSARGQLHSVEHLPERRRGILGEEIAEHVQTRGTGRHHNRISKLPELGLHFVHVGGKAGFFTSPAGRYAAAGKIDAGSAPKMAIQEIIHCGNLLRTASGKLTAREKHVFRGAALHARKQEMTGFP